MDSGRPPDHDTEDQGVILFWQIEALATKQPRCCSSPTRQRSASIKLHPIQAAARIDSASQVAATEARTAVRAQRWSARFKRASASFEAFGSIDEMFGRVDHLQAVHLPVGNEHLRRGRLPTGGNRACATFASPTFESHPGSPWLDAVTSMLFGIPGVTRSISTGSFGSGPKTPL